METETVDLNTVSIIFPEDNSSNEESVQSNSDFVDSTVQADTLTYEFNLIEELPGQFSANNGSLEQHRLQTKVKSKSCSRRTAKNKSNSKQEYYDAAEDKQSDEYRLRRERNNRFVRACREKARQRDKEVEHRVSELLTENKQLSQKVDALTSELVVYKNLFTSVGAPVPAEIDRILSNPINKPDIGSDV